MLFIDSFLKAKRKDLRFKRIHGAKKITSGNKILYDSKGFFNLS